MIIRSPEPQRNEVMSSQSSRRRSRSKTPLSLMGSGSYKKKNGYLPAHNTSRPSLLNSTYS